MWQIGQSLANLTMSWNQFWRRIRPHLAKNVLYLANWPSLTTLTMSIKSILKEHFCQIWFKNMADWPSLSNLTMVAHILFLEHPLVIFSDIYDTLRIKVILFKIYKVCLHSSRSTVQNKCVKYKVVSIQNWNLVRVNVDLFLSICGLLKALLGSKIIRTVFFTRFLQTVCFLF